MQLPASTTLNFDGGSFTPNDWTHIAVTHDATTKLHSHYIDGSAESEDEALLQ